jgi:ribosomal protein L32
VSSEKFIAYIKSKFSKCQDCGKTIIGHGICEDCLLERMSRRLRNQGMKEGEPKHE